jgi:hypothetical protein
LIIVFFVVLFLCVIEVQQKNYDQQKENYTMTQRKSTTKNYDQQKENYTMTQRKSTTKKL